MTDSISSVLSQIRSYQSQLGQSASAVRADSARSDAVGGVGQFGQFGQLGQVTQTGAPSFSETLSRAINGVSNAQERSGQLQKAFELGDPSADLAKVMVASQQAQVAFRATVEVRNRLVQAYQDVLNMPL